MLRLSLSPRAGPRTQYAHSYIGVGLSPIVAIDLDKGNKGSLREVLSVVRTFARFRPFTIKLEDGPKSVSTACCSPISRRWLSTPR